MTWTHLACLLIGILMGVLGAAQVWFWHMHKEEEALYYKMYDLLIRHYEKKVAELREESKCGKSYETEP